MGLVTCTALAGMAGSACGQSVPAYDYASLQTTTDPNFGYVAGVAHWYDGRAFTARVVEDAFGTQRTEIHFPLSVIDAYYTISGLPTLSDVWANDLSTEFPRVEAHLVGSTDPLLPACYVCGGFQTPIGDIDMEDESGDSGSAQCPTPGVIQAWMTKARDGGACAGTTNPCNPRVFCSNLGVEAMSVSAATRSAFATKWCAVGGWFKGTTEFGTSSSSVQRTAVGTQDGYVTILNASDAAYPVYNFSSFGDYVLTLGASGASVEVTGVAFAPDTLLGVTQGLLVITGSFTGTVDFDPTTFGVQNGVSVGGRDMFVAAYLVTDAIGGGAPEPFELVWLDTTGTENDDSGQSVAIDPTGDVYAVGWMGDGLTLGGEPSGDAYVAWYNEAPTIVGWGPLAPTHEFTLDDSNQTACDSKAMDVTLDGIGRVVVAGAFGNPGNAAPNSASIDLDPSAGGTVTVNTNGRRDAFVARYEPTFGTPKLLSFDWGFGDGTSGEDGALAIDADEDNSARLSYGGRVNDKPQAEFYKLQITESVDLVHAFVSDIKEHTLGDAIANNLIVPDKTDPNQPVVLVSVTEPDWDGYAFDPLNITDRGGPVQIVPPTVVTENTAALIRRRILDRQPSHTATVNRYSQGFEQVVSMADKNFLIPAFETDRKGHVVLLTQSGCDTNCNTHGDTAMQTARDNALAEDLYTHVDGFMFVNSPAASHRTWLLANIMDSEEKIPDAWTSLSSGSQERFLGLVGSPGNYTFSTNIVRRLCHWPGDYDNDGTVEVTFSYNCSGGYSGSASGDDVTAFLSASSPYGSSDWNYDTSINLDRPLAFTATADWGIDFCKFVVDALGGCP
ncbi:MAG: hypothetical protein H6815_08040 [Phycisphaeraceae bacterium]|nr:hypothetical protein [Phycisphaeraceae bacterium]